MINRIKQYLITKGIKMQRQIEDLDDLVKTVPLVDGYMISVTLLEGDSLNHYFLTKSFPLTDMLKSHKKVRDDLIIPELEKETPPTFIPEI